MACGGWRSPDRPWLRPDLRSFHFHGTRHAMADSILADGIGVWMVRTVGSVWLRPISWWGSAPRFSSFGYRIAGLPGAAVHWVRSAVLWVMWLTLGYFTARPVFPSLAFLRCSPCRRPGSASLGSSAHLLGLGLGPRWVHCRNWIPGAPDPSPSGPAVRIGRPGGLCSRELHRPWLGGVGNPWPPSPAARQPSADQRMAGPRLHLGSALPFRTRPSSADLMGAFGKLSKHDMWIVVPFRCVRLYG